MAAPIPHPNICPQCGDESDFQFQEVGTRVVRQPFSMGGRGEVADWDRYEASDDTTVTEYECRSCMWSWPTLAALRIAQEALPQNDPNPHRESYGPDGDEHWRADYARSLRETIATTRAAERAVTS